MPLKEGAPAGAQIKYLNVRHSHRNQKQSDARVAWIGAVIGAGFGLITLVVVMPMIRRRVLKDEERAAQ